MATHGKVKELSGDLIKSLSTLTKSGISLQNIKQGVIIEDCNDV